MSTLFPFPFSFLSLLTLAALSALDGDMTAGALTPRVLTPHNDGGTEARAPLAPQRSWHGGQPMCLMPSVAPPQPMHSSASMVAGVYCGSPRARSVRGGR